MIIEHPDAFVAGAINGHRLKRYAESVALKALDSIDFILDDRGPPCPRQRAGEYLIGFAYGLESCP